MTKSPHLSDRPAKRCVYHRLIRVKRRLDQQDGKKLQNILTSSKKALILSHKGQVIFHVILCICQGTFCPAGWAFPGPHHTKYFLTCSVVEATYICILYTVGLDVHYPVENNIIFLGRGENNLFIRKYSSGVQYVRSQHHSAPDSPTTSIIFSS